MIADPPDSGVPPLSPLFERAVADVRGTLFRDDLTVREIPAPQGLAPEAIALSGDVRQQKSHERQRDRDAVRLRPFP